VNAVGGQFRFEKERDEPVKKGKKGSTKRGTNLLGREELAKKKEGKKRGNRERDSTFSL